MRVVLVVPAFPKLSETFVVSKALGLLDRGWDVHVLCRRSESADWAAFPRLERAAMRSRVHVVKPPRTAHGVAVGVALAGLRSGYRRGAWRYGRDREVPPSERFKRWYLDEPLIRLRPDVVHFEFGALAVGRMHLERLVRCRTVVSFRGYDLNYVGLGDPQYYADVWEYADALHLLGEDLWERAQRRGCPSDKPHALIPPAIDAAAFGPSERKSAGVVGTVDRPLRILSVGRLAWTKGYEYALQAVRRLMDHGVMCRYTIVGGGSYVEAVAFARHQLGLADTVEFAGPLVPELVRARMREADVFLHAAVSEGFCNAVLEAQACQLPVVSSDAGGLPENVTDGDTGFVVPRRDPDALAEKLMRLAGDPELRLGMGRAGRHRVLKHFRTDVQIAAFEDLYRRVLQADDR